MLKSHLKWLHLPPLNCFIFCLAFGISVQVDNVVASPCPGKNFDSFFARFLVDNKVQKEFSLEPIVYRAFGSPFGSELIPFDHLPMNIQGRILPEPAHSGLQFKIRSFDKYVDVHLSNIPNTSFDYIFTYEKFGSCWRLTTMTEYE